MRLAIGFSAALLATVSCKVKDPLYCDSDTPCTDSERPFCDLNGEYPASEGIKHTCIADPFGAGNADGGPSGDAGGERTIVQLETGEYESCAVLSDGAVRCWGDLGFGELVGDNEFPRQAGDLETGAPVAQVAIGEDRTCIRYVAGNVRCWGDNSQGFLGYGHRQVVEGPPVDLPDLELGGAATSIVAGVRHFCALLESGDVRCWGNNTSGQLGLGHTRTVGDNDVPADEDPVDLGGVVLQLVAGYSHTCVVLQGGLVRCWGINLSGELGYGHEEPVGDDETPAQEGYVNVGGDVVAIAPGFDHTCAMLEGGGVRCWGLAPRLGIPGNSNDVGDTEDPATSGTTDIGGTAMQLVAGESFTCAVRADRTVVCWGGAGSGKIGYGTGDDNVGDDETPAEQGPVAVGGQVAKISSGGGRRNHSCVLLDSGDVRCWGENGRAQLGLGHLDDVGDNETPDSQDPVQILD
jgi:alpha-tubulin suppressor-like RCC1 family protein